MNRHNRRTTETVAGAPNTAAVTGTEVFSEALFIETVRERLHVGRREQADRSFGAPSDDLIEELGREALDLASLGAIMWARAEAMRWARVKTLRAALASRTEALQPRGRLTGLSGNQNAPTGRLTPVRPMHSQWLDG